MELLRDLVYIGCSLDCFSVGSWIQISRASAKGNNIGMHL